MKCGLAVLLAAVVALVVGCESKWTIAELVGDRDLMRIMEKARVVQVWRLAEKLPEAQSAPSNSGDSARNQFLKLQGQYQSIGEGVKLDQVHSEKLKKLLLSAPSYLRGKFPKETDFASKMCDFFPVVRIQFEDGRSSGEVWVCFFCSDLAFMHGNRVSGMEDFSPMSRELLALVKSALKDDPVIAKIRER